MYFWSVVRVISLELIIFSCAAFSIVHLISSEIFSWCFFRFECLIVLISVIIILDLSIGIPILKLISVSDEYLRILYNKKSGISDDVKKHNLAIDRLILK